MQVHDYYCLIGVRHRKQKSTVHPKTPSKISLVRLLDSFQPLPIPRNGRILGQLFWML